MTRPDGMIANGHSRLFFVARASSQEAQPRVPAKSVSEQMTKARKAISFVDMMISLPAKSRFRPERVR